MQQVMSRVTGKFEYFSQVLNVTCPPPLASFRFFINADAVLNFKNIAMHFDIYLG